MNNVEGDFYYDDDAGVGGRDGGLDDDYYYYEDDVGRGGGGGSSDGEGAVDLTENYEYIDRSTVDAGRTEYYDDEVDYYNSENSVRHNSLIWIDWPKLRNWPFSYFVGWGSARPKGHVRNEGKIDRCKKEAANLEREGNGFEEEADLWDPAAFQTATAAASATATQSVSTAAEPAAAAAAASAGALATAKTG